MTRKLTGLEVKMNYLVKRVEENSNEVKSLRADMNKAKGGIGILIMIGGAVGSMFGMFKD
jgi:hypothetical protein